LKKYKGKLRTVLLKMLESFPDGLPQDVTRANINRFIKILHLPDSDRSDPYSFIVNGSIGDSFNDNWDAERTVTVLLRLFIED